MKDIRVRDATSCNAVAEILTDHTASHPIQPYSAAANICIYSGGRQIPSEDPVLAHDRNIYKLVLSLRPKRTFRRFTRWRNRSVPI
jgi:hypothetical protein